MLPASVPYITYENFKDYRSPQLEIKTADIRVIKDMIERASRVFDANCDRTFAPYKDVRYYDHPDDVSCLKIGDDLLAVDSLYTENGEREITSDQYFLRAGDSYNVRPYDRIVMDDTTGVLFNTSTSIQRANILTAIWGYSEAYPSAWWPQDTLGAAVLATDTTFTTNDGTAFEWGQLLKINDEFILVTDSTTPTTPTIQRAMRGTTAAAHAQDDQIYIWQPHPDIVQGTLRLADFLYTQKDTKDASADRNIITTAGVILRPRAIPKDVMDTITAYTMPLTAIEAM